MKNNYNLVEAKLGSALFWLQCILLRLGAWGEGWGCQVTTILSHLPFSWAEIRLHVKFWPSRLPRTAITLLNPI